MKADSEIFLSDEFVISKIYYIREQKVMLDRDLARLYGVETKRLKEAVRRNIRRFPEDFMFELTKGEFDNWRSQFASSNSDKIGLRYTPFCFTEQGIAMLSSVLNSEAAVIVNIQIIRIFTKMRKTYELDKEIISKIDELDRKVIDHDDKLLAIFKYLEQFEKEKQKEFDQEHRKRIGF